MVPFRETVFFLAVQCKMNVAEKKILFTTLLKQKMLSQPHNQNIPKVTHTILLKDLVGQDSCTLFQLLATIFLKESPATWVKNDDLIVSIAARR